MFCLYLIELFVALLDRFLVMAGLQLLALLLVLWPRPMWHLTWSEIVGIIRNHENQKLLSSS